MPKRTAPTTSATATTSTTSTTSGSKAGTGDSVGDNALPGLLWIHGGGHIIGTPEMDDELCIRFAKEIGSSGCVVVAPDYRLAPENPYPADVEDCYEALIWLTERSNVDKARIAVAGQSAGGGLTAAVALMARDRKGPAIRFQMPLYPQLDYRNITASSNQITDHRVWCKDFNLAAWKMYLSAPTAPTAATAASSNTVSNAGTDVASVASTDDKGTGSNDGSNGSGANECNIPAYASPAMAEDLSGLPPAYIMVGTLDPFRDEDIAYAQRLMAAGVPVELHVIPGATHGFEGVFADAPLSINAVNEYVNALKEALK